MLYPDVAMPLAEMALRHKDIVCGIDVAGYENGHVYETPKEMLQVEAYQFAEKHGIRRTAHAGEAAGASSVTNVSNFHLIIIRSNFDILLACWC